jgi:hypothetical protein
MPRDDRMKARYEARFALIRPDQHVAWRGDVIPADCDALLAQVTGHLPLAEGVGQVAPGADIDKRSRSRGQRGSQVTRVG